ncbi:MAG TPA: fibronectin type III domain-containing protein, partial [Verrucomicrobiae bacterium]
MAVSLVAPFAVRAGSTAEYSVQVSANVKASPAQITLSWPQDSISTPKDYLVYRRAPGAASWGKATALPGSATTYVDKNVITGVPYEYQIVKQTAGYTGYGYIYSGIDVPLTENRGTLLLVVDNTYAAQLANELTRLQQDLVGDGWTVSRLDVSRSDTPARVKGLIKAQYNQDPANTKGVFLFGHVPVPYSGDIVPDGHYANHQGAWPCDGYYADMDGTWTDNSVNDTTAEDPRNHNVPGDGKFDQSKFPAPLKLMIGRVDLANMPGRMSAGGPATFPSELELLRNYLNKDHNFRNKITSAPERAIVGDYFGVRDGEAFAASGWRNFAPLFGADKITTVAKEGAWLPTLRTNAYLFAYGCGSGSYTSIGGIGSVGQCRDGVTTELVQDDVKAVFTLLYGSWLGDWDSEDNIQRAVLATKDLGLTCSWSGRPHWFMHHMALGEPIGFSARLTQNDGFSDLYKNQQNNCESWTHIALMGDPTLRMQMVAPASDVTVAATGSDANVTWTPSNDSVEGYNIYRATNPNGPFTRINSSLVKGDAFTDANVMNDSFTAAPHTGATLAMTGRPHFYYMVRAVKLEKSASGTYFNPSEGAFASMGSAAVNVAKAPAPAPTHPAAAKPQAKADYTMALGRDLPPTGATSTDTIWFDDAVPTGAVKDNNNDTWNWVTANPTAESGTRAHQSLVKSGMHQHMFSKAKQTLKVNTGDTVYTYIYIDPANVPSEVMLQWNDGSTWYHRAYWGANKLSFNTPTAASSVYMGPLPAAGQWVRLEVPASTVALEGATLSGMAFSLYGGRATWDNSGKSTPTVVVTNPPPTDPGTNSGPTNPTNSVSNTNDTSWVDDSIPAGATADYGGGDTWNWVTANPSPELGAKSHQSAIATGVHQQFFTGATTPLQINTGDKLYTYVYVDPANPPTEIMLQWNDGSSWEHRAYWGANSVAWGTDNTPALYNMGTIPTAGQWARLEVPASNVGLEGSSISGMAFTLYGGRVTWDNSGKSSVVATNNPSPTNTPPGTNTLGNVSVWFDDALPAGAVPDWNVDTWNWVGSNPSPESGTLAHQSAVAAGIHQHFFASAAQNMSVATGDILYTYVYIDPANVPSEMMLQWNDGTWEHRAYWGANSIQMGTDGTTGRHYMGAMPAAGQWVQLQVPASAVTCNCTHW